MTSKVAARFRKNQTQWRRVVEGHVGSGQSVRAYCATRGVRESAFYFWRRELARRDANRSSPRPAFVPVTVASHPDPSRAGTLEIILDGQRRVHLSGAVDKQMLSDVLAVLASSPAAGHRQEGQAC